MPSLAQSNTSSPSINTVVHDGEYEIAPIRSPLDNKILFEVTTPNELYRKKVSMGASHAEVRAKEINERLWRVLKRTIDAKQTPIVSIATLNNRLILQISDDQSSYPIRLLTVTEPDTDRNGASMEELAKQWQKIIQDEIFRFQQIASPAAFLQRLGRALKIFFELLITTAVIWFLRKILSKREQALENIHQENLKTSKFSLERRLKIDKFLQWALFWLLILIWYLGIARIVSIIPILMFWSDYVWKTPLLLITIWFLVSLGISISKTFIERSINSWKNIPLFTSIESQRIHLRSRTITGALQGLSTVFWIFLGIVWTLSLFNVPTNSILAGGALLGLAISFGSQNLIKDLVNGCFILIEDQFGIGDIIEVDNKSGLVENLNLRITQLRNNEGQLVNIPNGNITRVSNLTRLWSRVDFSIVVDYDSDPDFVLDILNQVCVQIYNDSKWQEYLLEMPEVLGIEDISYMGIKVGVWLKTRPLEQWKVAREFRLRVKRAFAEHNIQIGKPEITESTHGNES
ncbi:MAG: mechanosensitive ion channel domain-containing protein [Cyanobacteriota bacterium ELA615]